MRVNDWWRRVRGTLYGGRTKYQGPHVRLQGTGSEDGETGTRGVQSSSMQADYVGVRRGPQAGDGAARLGRQQAGRIWVVQRGASRRHTRQLTAWVTHRGRRYMQIPARPGHSGTKGPLPACLPLGQLRGSGRGALHRALSEGLEGKVSTSRVLIVAACSLYACYCPCIVLL